MHLNIPTDWRKPINGTENEIIHGNTMPDK